MAKTGAKAAAKKSAAQTIADKRKTGRRPPASADRASAPKKRVAGKAKEKKVAPKKAAPKKPAATASAVTTSAGIRTPKAKVTARTAKKAARASVSALAASATTAQAKPPAPVSLAKDGCAPGSPWLIPSLIVRTVEAAIDFYQRAFGFQVDFTMPSPTGAIGYAQLRHEAALIHLSPEGAYGINARAPVTAAVECPATLYVYCADVDAMAVRARAAGATILSEPADMFWGDRVASLSDPEGYRWAFATHLGAFDSTRPIPGSYPKAS